MKRYLEKLFVKLLWPFRVAVRRELRRESGMHADLMLSDKPIHTSGGAYEPLQDIRKNVLEIAGISTAKYVMKHMNSVRAFNSQQDLLEFAVSVANITPNSIILEFGVYSGNTINILANQTSSAVFGFDSFDGLPEIWRTGFDKGDFSKNSLPKVSSNVTLVKGLFSDTLPEFEKTHTQEIALIHVDCDLYSSTKTIFETLKNRIKSGCVIVFDEYFNFPGWKVGEFKAFQEFIEESGLRYEYVAYNALHEQAVVKIC